MHAEVNWVFTKLWVPVPNGVAAQHAPVRAMAVQGVHRAEVVPAGSTNTESTGNSCLISAKLGPSISAKSNPSRIRYSPLFSTRAPATSLVGHGTASPSTRLPTQLELP